MADMKAALMTLPASGPETGQWPWFDDEKLAAAARVLRSGASITGRVGGQGVRARVRRLLRRGVRHRPGERHGRARPRAEGAGIGPGDEVIVTPRTFMASASLRRAWPARAPVFADVDPRSARTSPRARSRAVSARDPGDHRRAPRRLALRHGRHHGSSPSSTTCCVIEDCAQAHGATLRGPPVGIVRRRRRLLVLPGQDHDHRRRRRHAADRRRRASGARVVVQGPRQELRQASTPRRIPPGFRWLHDRSAPTGG